jgi:uncharacterized membrane protein
MEEIAKAITIYISHALEIIAALVIAAGLMQLVIKYFNSLPKEKKYLTAGEAMLKFGSVVAVALEFLLGADVLATAVSPGWDDIGKLAAIATIRTSLNYFLEKELKHINQVKKANA